MDDNHAVQFRYWAFISYSSKDASWARWLQRGIESYGIPAALAEHATPAGEPAPKRLKPVFRDREELAAGDLGAQIEEALRASRFLIVVCSPNAAQSKWVNKEIESFQALGRSARVLTLIVDGEPNAGDERECFPPALRATEPLAADAREAGDGKRDARLKLLAGMLGVGFDALKQRDQHRRIRRLQMIIALVLALVVSFAAVAGYALVQRNTANEKRKEATEQRDKAVASRQRAEGLLVYLLYDLPYVVPDGFEEGDVQYIADEYYRQIGVDRNRSWHMREKGDRLMKRGDSVGALEQYEMALGAAQALVRAQPDNLMWLEDLFQCHLTLASALLTTRDDLEGSQKHCESALEIAQIQSSLDSESLSWRKNLALGHLYVAFGLDDPKDALWHYQRSLDNWRLVIAGRPSGSSWETLSLVHDSMAGLLEKQGDSDRALRHYRTALEIVNRLLKKDPDNDSLAQKALDIQTSIERVEVQ